MTKTQILFVCIHNSARSVMAEAFVNSLLGDRFEAHSAGIEPGRLNPVVAQAMSEIGLDVSNHQPQSVADVLARGDKFDLVATVCDETSAERCPVFPGQVKRLHMSFPDPSALTGTPEEKLEGTRRIRDQIKAAILRDFDVVSALRG